MSGRADQADEIEIAALYLGDRDKPRMTNARPIKLQEDTATSQARSSLRAQVASMRRLGAALPACLAAGGKALTELLDLRRGIIKWFDGCARAYSWNTATVFLALSLWDRYLAATLGRQTGTAVLRLAAYVAALVASKLEEPPERCLNMRRMSQVVSAHPTTGGAMFTPEQVRVMELSLLRELHFELLPPLPADLAAALSRLLPRADASAARDLVLASIEHLRVMRWDATWLRHDALTLAVAALACALASARRGRALHNIMRAAESAAGRPLDAAGVVECAAIVLGSRAAALALLPGGRSSPTGVDGVERIEAEEAWGKASPSLPKPGPQQEFSPPAAAAAAPAAAPVFAAAAAGPPAAAAVVAVAAMPTAAAAAAAVLPEAPGAAAAVTAACAAETAGAALCKMLGGNKRKEAEELFAAAACRGITVAGPTIEKGAGAASTSGACAPSAAVGSRSDAAAAAAAGDAAAKRLRLCGVPAAAGSCFEAAAGGAAAKRVCSKGVNVAAATGEVSVPVAASVVSLPPSGGDGA